jgi:hypothetical protein
MAASRDTLAPRELDLLLIGGIEVLTRLVPDWEPPVLAHPHAVPYDSLVDLIDDIVPGDQVMVKALSGYYHHGIFVGKQNVAGTYRSAVVDFWGDDKEDAAIGVRSLNDFVRGAAGFAKADYPHGAAHERELSARVALAWVESEKRKRTIYNVALKNCEVFATICRCARCAGACHGALTQKLADLPVVAPAPFRRGFK